MRAAGSGDINTIKLMLADKVKVNCRDQSGNYALMYAASGGHTDTVKALLDVGAEVNVRGDDGSTPIMHAVLSGNPRTVKVLLNAGAEVNVKNNIGYTALMIASDRCYTNLIQLFRRSPDGGYTEIVQLLKKAGGMNKIKYCNQQDIHTTNKRENEKRNNLPVQAIRLCDAARASERKKERPCYLSRRA